MIIIPASDIKFLVNCNLYIYSRYKQWWPVPCYHKEAGYLTSIYLDSYGLKLDVGSYYVSGSSKIMGYIDYIKP